jgi:uncharacterized membrane protein
MRVSRNLRIALIVLAVLGICWAGYLTYVHYSGATPVCSLKGDPCAAVQKSKYSELAGVPVALIGLVGYFLIFCSLLVSDDERVKFATAALTLGGFGFSAYLTYREIFTLHKICEDCVASAILMTIIMCLSIWRFLRSDDPPPSASPAGPESGPSASALHAGS